MSIEDRLSSITRLPVNNAEPLQILRYDQGEYYRTHHDFNGGVEDGPAGGRVYSFVLFLGTPLEGGELFFADLNFSVPARKGSAVLWPTLMSEDLTLPELLTHHASQPVVRGTKLAATTWLHAYDWRTVYLRNRCRGSGAPRAPPLALLPAYLAARESAGLKPKVPASLLAKAREASGMWGGM